MEIKIKLVILLTTMLFRESKGQFYQNRCKRRVCVLNLVNFLTIYKTRIDVNPIYCTHMVVNYAEITNQQEIFVKGYCNGEIFQVKDLRSENPYMRIILSIQNKNFTDFVTMYTTDSLRQNFISSIIHFLRIRGFDGVKIDVQPGEGGDKYKFNDLFKELMTAMYEEAAQTESRKLVLSVGIPSNKTFLDMYYDVATLSKYVDMLDLASYDFKGPIYDLNPVHHSPLYVEDKESTKTIDFLAYYVASKGVKKDKINVGLSLMGMRHLRTNTDPRYWRGLGPVNYAFVCSLKKFGKDYSVEPERGRAIESGGKVNGVYMRKVFYDDPETLRSKVRYVVSSGYGGVLLYTVRDDDGSNRCKQGQYPLLTVIYEECSLLQLMLLLTPNSVKVERKI